MTALFNEHIFGPIRSRRLGTSLGINLLPRYAKICNFDCVYCECGFNEERRGEAGERRFADVEELLAALRERLESMNERLDVITFAGNGEPTLHPNFEQIISGVKDLRDRFAPGAKISLLSNATTLDKPSVVRAMKMIDNNIMKIDSAIEESAARINAPQGGNYSVQKIIEQLSSLDFKIIVQTMFLKGKITGKEFDNTSEEEINAWLEGLNKIRPSQVMIYSIDRDTPHAELEKIEREQLEKIAAQVETLGINCSVS